VAYNRRGAGSANRDARGVRDPGVSMPCVAR